MSQDEQEERGAALGDPRRCPAHGHPTSSPDGMHDSPCPGCESEQDEMQDEREREDLRASQAGEHADRVAELRERGRLG